MKKYSSMFYVFLVAVLVVGCTWFQARVDPTPVVIDAQSVSITKFRSVLIEHDLEVDGTTNLDGTSFDVDVTGAISLDADAASNFNTAGAGIDLTLESEAGTLVLKGDEAAATGITIDADDAAGTGVTIAVGSSGGLNIGGGLTDIGGGTGGTADGDNDLLVAADAEVDDTLDVDGDFDLDGDGFDVDITAGASIDADGATNLSASTGDITIDAEAGSLLLIGSEAAADSILLDANDTVTSGLDIDVGSVSGLTIDGGLTDIGGGTCGVADGDNDVCIAAVLEVDGETELDGALDADSTSNFADTATFSKGSGNAILISAGGTISLPNTSDVRVAGYATVGNGTPDGSVTDGTDRQLYVEGAFEVDGEAEFDGIIDADSTSNFADTATFSKGSGNAVVVAAGGTVSLAAGSKIKSSTTTTGTLGVVFNCSGTHAHTDTEAVVSLCEVPANANVVDVHYFVTTQWNDGASAVVDCGISGGDIDAFVDNMNINDAADGNRMGDAADMPIATSFIDVGASDVEIICKVAEGNNDASTGAATLSIWYILD
jgi:hypothetical protein